MFVKSKSLPLNRFYESHYRYNTPCSKQLQISTENTQYNYHIRNNERFVYGIKHPHIRDTLNHKRKYWYVSTHIML